MKKQEIVGEDLAIYNCHIHTFTQKNAPRQFYKFLFLSSRTGKISLLVVFEFLLAMILFVLSTPAILIRLIVFFIKNLGKENRALIGERLIEYGKSYTSFWVKAVENFFPAPNDLLERYARFLNTSSLKNQLDVFKNIERQYPDNSVFVVLPMDMKYMGLGKLDECLEDQHNGLLALANEKEYKGRVIPFYAADPRREDLIEQVQENLKRGKFQGIKIYPNLGYDPNHDSLMKVYEICEKKGYPVITHCSTGGIFQYKLKEVERKKFSKPDNYRNILQEFPKLKFCLAHFGGQEEWEKQIKKRASNAYDEDTWVKVITDMIKEIDPKTKKRKYPNLFTDISYTIFTPKIKGLYIDLVDYLKVLLSTPAIGESVLYGSDYYMVEQEEISEKEAAILLRSRLGEDLYKQIAHTNPKRFLGIEN